MCKVIKYNIFEMAKHGKETKHMHIRRVQIDGTFIQCNTADVKNTEWVCYVFMWRKAKYEHTYVSFCVRRGVAHSGILICLLPKETLEGYTRN